MKIENGKKVKLCTFSGTSTSEKPTRPSENYWKLIGQTGTVIAQEGEAGLPKHKLGTRVLVEFSTSIPELGLSCHNEAPNSLWILVTDLIIIPES
ncbi:MULTISPECIES: hypothetical protein [unclassified Pseudomonas]|jgi:hypothetical protein|uniref:hypothetical protein n=1 Tax=unclassified Pseudomonas TaxID=196821 RepID=UPI00117B9065|nr:MULTISPECIES: hypothetical protein [unclassified Pseudomonas]